MSVGITDEAFGVYGVDPLTTLGMRRRHLEGERVLRPWVGVGAIVRRAREDLELRHRRGTLAMGGTEAVGARVAAADDHHVLAVDVDRRVVDVAELHPVAVRQV